MRSLLAWVALGALPLGAAAQAPQVPQAPQAPPAAEPPAKPPGLLHLGPFWLNPRFNIGSVGLDTNVFYTATDRRTDVRGSGGPGLEVILPLGGDLAIKGDGGLDYLYYARTPELRRLTGGGFGRLEWAGERLLAGAQHGYNLTFGRPSLEVDERIEQEEVRTFAELRIKAGHRLTFGLEGVISRQDAEPGATYLGTDLQRTLTRRTERGFFELGYRLTPKTSLIAEVDYQADRFRLRPSRDADSNRLGGGFRLESRTRLAGRAVAGVRSFRPLAARSRDAQLPYAQADLTYHFGPRTRLVAGYSRDLQYSAFETTGDTPTVAIEHGRLRLEKGLGGRFDLRLSAGLTSLVTDGAVRIVPDGGPAVTTVRDDTVLEAGAELGYTFRARLRIGAAAAYTERRSTIADLGIEGLLLGGTITFTP